MSPFWAGSLASLVAGSATGLGALLLFGLREPTERQQKLLLGFAAGVMLAASFFSLIIPALAQAQELGASKVAAACIVIIAVLIGGLSLGWLSAAVPRWKGTGLPLQLVDERSRRIWLFIAAITLHNFPEGMAVGVSFGTGDTAAGMTTAIGIGLQNIPEGLAVAGAAMALGYRRGAAFIIALLTGLAEPLAGVAGAGMVALAQSLLPWGLGIAAGAMIYIVVADILPDIHDQELQQRNMAMLMFGLALMMFLDVALG